MDTSKLEKALKSRLRGPQNRIAILGIGSELRGDDVAGMAVAGELEKYRSRTGKRTGLKVFFGSTAPENLTGEIRSFKPTHLIIVDSADLKKKPGSAVLIEPEDAQGVSFCTHRLPDKILADYLIATVKCEVMIIGIQPKTLKFGSLPSKEVLGAVKGVSGVIKKIVS